MCLSVVNMVLQKSGKTNNLAHKISDLEIFSVGAKNK